MCLQGGEVSRRNGSGGGGGGPGRDPNASLLLWYLTSTSPSRAVGYDVRDVCVSGGGRDPFAQPHWKDRTPQRRALREAEVSVPITSSGSKLRTFALVSRLLGYLSIAEEPCLVKQHPMSDNTEPVTSSVRPGVTRHTRGRAKTARTIVQILGPYRSQQVSVFAITAYLPWSIRKSGA